MVIKLELKEIFPHINVGLILLNIPFFRGLLIHGTKYIMRLEMHPLQFLRNTYYRKFVLSLIWFTIFHLNEHIFNHNFESCINPLCTCSLEVESTSHFFLHCHYYDSIRHIFIELCEVDVNLPNASDEKLVNFLS